VKNKRTILVVVVSTAVLIGILWFFASGRNAEYPLGWISHNNSSDVYFLKPGLEGTPPDQIFKAEVKYSRITGKVKAVKTYRTLDEYKAGMSEWFNVDGNSSAFPISENREGIFAVPRFPTYSDDGRLISYLPSSQGRLVKLVFPLKVSQQIREGRYGDIQAGILTQLWDTLPKGAPLRLQGHNDTNFLRKDLAGLVVRIAVTNTTGGVQEFRPYFWVVANPGILLFHFTVMDSKLLDPTQEKPIGLQPFEHRVLELATGYMFEPGELRNIPPATIIQYNEGWEWKVEEYSSQPRASKPN
jgi:hypothetical protein